MQGIDLGEFVVLDEGQVLGPEEMEELASSEDSF
jgi:hypothetical protein